MLRSGHLSLRRAVARSSSLDADASALQFQMDITRGDEQKTLAAATARFAHVQKVSRAQAVKYNVSGECRQEKADLAKAVKSCAAGERAVPRDRFRSRGASAPHGLFFEVKEGACPTADWTITLFNAARPWARNVFLQTNSV